MLEQLTKALTEQYLWDLSVMSQAWMYWGMLIPIMFYLMFFIIKWSILTLPVWIVPVIIISSFRKNK